MELQEFEKRLKQAKEESVPFDAEFHWESLSERLDNELPVAGRKRLLAWWFALFAIVLVGSVALFSLNNRSYEIDELILPSIRLTTEDLSNIKSQNLAAVNPNASKLTGVQPLEIALLAESSVADASNKMPAENDLSKRTNNSNVSDVQTSVQNVNPISTFVNEFQTPGIISRKDEEQKVSDLGESIDHSKTTGRKQPTVAFIPSKLDLLDISMPVVKGPKRYTRSPFAKRERKHKQLNIAILGGMSKPMGDYKASSADLANLAELHNSAFDALEAFNLQILAEYPLGEHFKLAAGIDYSEINQLFQQEIEREITRTLENVVIGIRVNTITGDTTFITGDVEQTGTSFQTVRHYNSLISLSVPLQFQYHTSLHTFGLGFTVGTLFTFNQRQKGRFLDINGQLNENTTVNVMGIKQFFVSPSVSHPLSHQLDLEFRPFAQFYLDDLSPLDGISYKPILVGAQVGVRYSFDN